MLCLMETVRDIERIGDHFENIIELIDYPRCQPCEIDGRCDG